MKIAIAHAAWLPERTPTASRLSRSLKDDVMVFHSTQREHASVWAKRLWSYAEQHSNEHTVCLNDDVEVHPRFVDVINAMTCAVPDKIISLHTTSPVAKEFAIAGERWLRSYWCTGPGYILPPGAARELLTWIDTLPQSVVASTNEDNLIMHWAWHEQKPIWHCIPALVKHDVTVGSSLGYDNQPSWMRVSDVGWDAEVWSPASRDHHKCSITQPEFWSVSPREDPMLVECPWMTRERLSMVERFLYNRHDLCSFCHKNDGQVASQNTGAKICKVCLVKVMAAAVGS